MRKMFLWVALLVCVPLAVAQVGTSSLTGRITDPSGSVVPNVGVTVVNTDTTFRFTAVTSAEGLYRVISLQPGPYRLTFEAAGFKRVLREDITLRGGDVLAVDVALEVGGTTESVNVLRIFSFHPPTTTVDLQNPKTFAKLTADPNTSWWGGQPLMNIGLALTW